MKQKQGDEGETEANPEGLKLLYQPEPPQVYDVDIIAVHGLGGHAYKTWTHLKTGKLWLKDMLPNEEKFRGARVFTYGYDARTAFTNSLSSILDISNNLVADLAGEMQAIHMARDSRHDSYRRLYDMIYGVVFMGTPHQGSSMANLGSIASSIVTAMGIPTNPKLVKSLKKDSSMLGMVSNSFTNWLDHLHIVSFYKMDTMLTIRGPVVNKNSAILRTGQEKEIGIQANHRDIVKFRDTMDPGYKKVIRELSDLIDGALNPEVSSSWVTVYSMCKENTD
ncbi:hypothetical protein BDD12DRAFT_878614 [Trichophaea hybrida]|nr:hypothetical protein BDD12DRAFT_878614 [Trichophaea hybrida]